MPVLARKPSLWNQAIKWTRRHKPFAVSMILTLLLACLASTISSFLIAHEQSNLTFALSATAKNFSPAFRRSSLASADRVTQTSVVETYPLESPTAKLR
jgi:hypothetical protein